MRPVMATICRMSLLAGCASGARQGEARPPLCTTLGCIEADPVRLAPQGAELRFTECEDGRMNSYQYEKVGSGWRLVLYRTELSAECAAAGSA